MFKTSCRMDGIKQSAIRKYAQVAASDPRMVSFSNGNPSPSTFPVEAIKKAFDDALTCDYSESLLKYGTTMGYQPLIDVLKERLSNKYGFDWNKNDIFMVSGGTQSADIVSKLMLDKGDSLITEEPSYSSIYNVFHCYEASLLGVPMEEDGMDLDAAESYFLDNAGGPVKFIYTIPSFQNPTGFTTSEEKRKKLYGLAEKYDTAILEDDPYAELNFSGEELMPIKSLDKSGRVFYTSSFSKIIAPSFRLGYLIADKGLTEKLTVAKQCTDMHTNTLAQYVAWHIMTKTDYEGHIKGLRAVYKKKAGLLRDTLLNTMHAGCSLSDPKGGMFMMLFLSEGVDAGKFADKAIERGVVCVPGSGFAIDGSLPSNSIRMCYATPSDDDIVKGAAILGKLTMEMAQTG